MRPETFEQGLRNYDPRLRLRWGHVIEAWVVERECPVSPALLAVLIDGMKKAVNLLGNPAVPDERKYDLMKACEEGYSAGNGRRVILYTAMLDNRVFDTLWHTDLQRHGVELVERTRNRREAQVKKNRHERFEDLSRETCSVMDWALRKHTSEIEAGKSDELIAEAFGREKPVKGRRPVSVPSLTDFTGVPIGGVGEVKLEVANG